MRSSLLLSLIPTFLAFQTLQAQLIWSEPYFPKQDEPVTIYFNAQEGGGGLEGCNCNVYVHAGVLLQGENGWQNVQTTWGQANPDWQMTPISGEDDMYSYDFTPNITDYFNVATNDTVTALALVFRNATGSLVGKDVGEQDIFYTVYPDDLGLATKFLRPAGANNIFQVGETLSLWGVSSENADLSLYENGNLLTQTTGTSITYELDISAPGNHEVKIVADNGVDISESTFYFAVPLILLPQDLPPGAELGINLLGDTSMILALYAPGKETVFAIGTFSNWLPNTDFQMRQTTDGTTWWTKVDGLQAGETYTFQYFVDGQIRVADPYSTLVLDPSNDLYIPSVTYPDLPEYPAFLTTGYVSAVQPGAPEYEWAIEDFDRPDKTELTVYELLIRDFIARHDYTTLIDTLDYLQNLGINAIELMPVNEFEGNISWGYNPSFHMALDKYYGPINEFKRFVDTCHARGIAVILDVVYNHAFGQSPLAQLYFDGNKPTPDNPWLNPDAKHPYNVGYDFNHESPATKYFVKKVTEYWVEEFKIDGFRFDLSKGFTQVNNPDNVGAWGAYDASRIAIWKDYADAIWSVDPETYIILEHFADNNEEKELANYGMMLWANNHGAYTQTGKGFFGSLNDISYKARGFAEPHLVHYMESHDEERIMYSALQTGNQANPWHKVRDLEVALKRIELNSAFFYTVPGPKMLWQFGELGYDVNIDFNGRTGPKPIKWEYFTTEERRRLYDVISALTFLRNNFEVFHTEDFFLRVNNANPQNKVKSIQLSSPAMNVNVLGNFDVWDFSIVPYFQHTGTWYEYFSGDSLLVDDALAPIMLTPSEYRLYSDVKLPAPPYGYLQTSGLRPEITDAFRLQLSPNPSEGLLTAAFSLPQSMEGSLELYDLSGKRVQTLFEGKFSAGENVVSSQLQVPTGTYLVLLTAGGKSQVERVLVQ
ncbi:MAG: T9SS type A sorting domain-containing protein [Saprospirales bacterium]|nr:T9SS type A sorting domain-containing protein [Saprospirales bacterium]